MGMKIQRLGLGCMGMSQTGNPVGSAETIRYALRRGITHFNTGDAYCGGESEMMLRQVLRDVPRDDYFLSVKFGELPLPQGGVSGLDVAPAHIKSHLTYSLRRLGVDYIDLYQPARMDPTYPVEEIVGALSDLVKEGYIRHIGLSQVDAATLRRASRIHHIHSVEKEYSLLRQEMEGDLVAAASECNTNLVIFGVLAHGLITEHTLSWTRSGPLVGVMDPAELERSREIIRKFKPLAKEKGVTISQLAYAWVLNKLPYAQCLAGTSNQRHLEKIIEALDITLTPMELAHLEEAGASQRHRSIETVTYLRPYAMPSA